MAMPNPDTHRCDTDMSQASFLSLATTIQRPFIKHLFTKHPFNNLPNRISISTLNPTLLATLEPAEWLTPGTTLFPASKVSSTLSLRIHSEAGTLILSGLVDYFSLHRYQSCSNPYNRSMRLTTPSSM